MKRLAATATLVLFFTASTAGMYPCIPLSFAECPPKVCPEPEESDCAPCETSCRPSRICDLEIPPEPEPECLPLCPPISSDVTLTASCGIKCELIELTAFREGEWRPDQKPEGPAPVVPTWLATVSQPELPCQISRPSGIHLTIPTTILLM